MDTYSKLIDMPERRSSRDLRQIITQIVSSLLLVIQYCVMHLSSAINTMSNVTWQGSVYGNLLLVDVNDSFYTRLSSCYVSLTV